MSEDEKKNPPSGYTVLETKHGFLLAMSKENVVISGFPSADAAHGWLLNYFDTNAMRNTRLAREAVEREKQLDQTLRLQRAAMLEVDPNANPN